MLPGDRGVDLHTFHKRRAKPYLAAVGHQQHVLELDGLAGFHRQAVHLEGLALAGDILLAARTRQLRSPSACLQLRFAAGPARCAGRRGSWVT